MQLHLASLSIRPAVNEAISDAKGLPDFVAKAGEIAPALATQITGKSLLASKTPWGTLLTAIVAYLASKFALGWDANLCAMVAGAGVLAGSYAMRAITSAPITSVLPVTTPTSASAPPPVSSAGASAMPAAIAMLMLCLLPLSACDTLPTPSAVSAAATATISASQRKLQTAINLWGIAKGIGEMATLADPSLAPIVQTAVNAVDPQVAKAQAVLHDATIDAAAITALAEAITAQANALTVKTAGKITVVPNAPAATAPGAPA